ncbi:UDP-2,3-diacylglucosamine hydrolase [Variovorax sp. OK605]|uniref:UDP-2,3-diacylglucosamine diphosphatase n=1 Tax=Variovorax sp. OK605 TaxID=1855317 RepID=UPI0008DFBFDA|nr:UDP-2,3-diacylglucosamine diphosphatase [Variovorax sp. OK605]SFP73823.1 UDP-2,3-diacylglucosamine hydrolase [Variovorax sp. OK605]
MTAFKELVAPPAWRTVDLISDLHLQAGEPATSEAWQGYLQTTPADALIILGDLFEVWVGDDSAASASSADAAGFEAQCAELLRRTAQRLPVFFMHGNRDFLVGPAFAAQCGLTLLDDPTVLVLHGQRWLLSHGDILCLEDTEYLKFRAQVRTPEWQAAFLARPLEERRALARSMRVQSEDRKRNPSTIWADVDNDAARDWLLQANARTLVHGHTHRPANHDLGHGLQRIVLSDWDAAAHPPRAQLLCLSTAGAQRVDLR